MKITLKELRSIVRESVRSHLKETEIRDLSNQEGPFIGSDVSRETSTNDPEFVDMVRPIFDKYSWSINGRPPAIHHYATIDSYPAGLRGELEPYLNAKEELNRLSHIVRRRNPARVRELNRIISSMGRDVGNLKELAIREVAEELGLVPEQVLELPAVRTVGLSGGLTLNNLAGIAKVANEKLSSKSIEDLRKSS